MSAATKPLTRNELGSLNAELQERDAGERLRLLADRFAGRARVLLHGGDPSPRFVGEVRSRCRRPPVDGYARGTR